MKIILQQNKKQTLWICDLYMEKKQKRELNENEKDFFFLLKILIEWIFIFIEIEEFYRFFIFSRKK